MIKRIIDPIEISNIKKIKQEIFIENMLLPDQVIADSTLDYVFFPEDNSFVYNKIEFFNLISQINRVHFYLYTNMMLENDILEEFYIEIKNLESYQEWDSFCNVESPLGEEDLGLLDCCCSEYLAIFDAEKKWAYLFNIDTPSIFLYQKCYSELVNQIPERLSALEAQGGFYILLNDEKTSALRKYFLQNYLK